MVARADSFSAGLYRGRGRVPCLGAKYPEFICVSRRSTSSSLVVDGDQGMSAHHPSGHRRLLGAVTESDSVSTILPRPTATSHGPRHRRRTTVARDTRRSRGAPLAITIRVGPRRPNRTQFLVLVRAQKGYLSDSRRWEVEHGFRRDRIRRCHVRLGVSAVPLVASVTSTGGSAAGERGGSGRTVGRC